MKNRIPMDQSFFWGVAFFTLTLIISVNASPLSAAPAQIRTFRQKVQSHCDGVYQRFTPFRRGAAIDRMRALGVIWRRYPFIPLESLSFVSIEKANFEKMGGGGIQNKGLGVGVLNRKKVFVKVVDTKPVIARHEVFTEYQWLVFLNQLDLAPRVYGVTQVQGQWAVVMERVQGFNSQAVTAFNQLPGFKLTRSMIFEMREAAKRLEGAGVTRALDLQFILTADGHAILIDPEWYSLSKVARLWLGWTPPTVTVETKIRLLRDRMQLADDLLSPQ